MKFPQTALGTSQQQNSGIRAREPRAVLGPSPDRADQRASVRACCHRVEARPRSRELWGTPRPPPRDPVPAREPQAPGHRPNRAQMALAERPAGLLHP